MQWVSFKRSVDVALALRAELRRGFFFFLLVHANARPRDDFPLLRFDAVRPHPVRADAPENQEPGLRLREAEAAQSHQRVRH